MANETPRARKLPTLPGLDGIRALAVVAVLLYHADLPGFPGGFLGVEVFFVLSGYLITALLLTEATATGTISLTSFWMRRARRLLPALFAMLLVVAIAFVFFWPEEVGRIRGDIAAAVGYVSNWYLIGIDSSYFASLGRPSPFGHLWSLGIEEQFYLLWPLLFGGLALKVRKPARIASIIGILAVASAVSMWLLYVAADPSRAYFGTDSRAAGLLIGAGLAVVWRPFESSRRSLVKPVVFDAAIVASTAFLLWSFTRFDEFASFTYRPGIQLVSLATALLIAATVHPSARLSRAMSWGPVVALGKRSYSIYLWHWPVYVVTRPGVDMDMGVLPAFGLRLAITLALSEASYRWVEQPIRSGGLGRLRRWVGDRAFRTPASFPRVLAGSGGTLLVGFLSLALLTNSLLQAPAPKESALARSLGFAAEKPTGSVPVAVEVAREIPPRSLPIPEPKPGEKPPPAPPLPFVPLVRADVVAVGDSVMLGARYALPRKIRNVYVDASVSRSVPAGLAVMRRLREADRLGDAVVVHLGNNGVFSDDEFDKMMHFLRDVEKVVVVNVKVARRWEPWVNSTISRGISRHPQVALVDWHTRWRSCPSSPFASDGIHLTSSGALCYATLIAAEL